MFGLIYAILVLVQSFMAFGTAYRWTRNMDGNGIVLFFCLLLCQLMAWVPGLGIFLWVKSLDSNQSTYYEPATRRSANQGSEDDVKKREGITFKWDD